MSASLCVVSRTVSCLVVLTIQYNTIQYKFIYMAAISWTKRKTITHKQGHAFKITLLEVGQRKRYKRVLKTSCPCTNGYGFADRNRSVNCESRLAGSKYLSRCCHLNPQQLLCHSGNHTAQKY